MRRAAPDVTGLVSDSNEPVSLLVDDLDEDNTSELYALTGYVNYFPALLLRYDPATGREQTRYANAGRLRTLEAVDLEGDDVQEIPVGGTVNSFDQAAECFVRQGRLDSLPGGDYFRDLEGKIPYWSGVAWQTEPTMRSCYEADTAEADADA